MTRLLASPESFSQFVEYDSSGSALGFIEASLHHDYVNGCSSSPVAFLEGIYVAPAARMQGVARALVAEAERWAAAAGCSEFASDTQLENADSHAMHAALGFKESQRVVFFKKSLQ
jgi:aminoglycoside 6'-N-acetyltransferase I